MLTELLITGGVLYAGLKVYRRKQRNNKLIEYIQPPRTVASSQNKSVVFSFDEMKQAMHLFRGTRQQNPSEFASNEDRYQIAQMHRQINQKVVVAASSLAVAMLGKLVYWPLNLLVIPGVLYGSSNFHKKTYAALRQGRLDTNTIVTITMVGALTTGYFSIAAFAIFLHQLSFKLVLMTTDDSRQRLVNVFRQVPTTVWLLVDGVEIKVPFTELRAGDIIVVHAGALIPADGTIVKGMATIDQHILTGESKPAEKGVGEVVFASTVVISGQINICVEKTGQETTVAKIGHILNQTVEFKSTQQLRAENLANSTVGPTILLGALSLLFINPISSLAVINAHFKSKMSVLAPISILNYLNQASQTGILVKDGRSLDLLNQVDTLVFDKTGTLTIEQPHVGMIHCCLPYTEQEVLGYAAAAEYKQTHPIAKAILEEAEKRQLEIPLVEDTNYKIGYGLTVKLDDHVIQVGSHRFMETSDIAIPPTIKQTQEESHALGHSLIMVACDQQLIGAIELVPTVRPEATAIIQQLRQQSNIKEIYIISGDHELPTKRLTEALEIDHYFAETLPEHKADLIEQLRAEGRFVCYVGDGINDSIALKTSQVSISLRGASTVATDTAQIILLDQGLSHLPYLFDLAQAYNRNMETSFIIIIVPTLIGMGGALFLGFGLGTTILLNLTGLVVGLGNTMLPTLKPVKNNYLISDRSIYDV